MASFIDIVGARANNLKNVNLRIPRDKLVVFTGLSGSGKSSLAFDTIVEEDSLQAFGIRHITKADVDNFRALGKVCKLLVRAKKYNDGRIAAFVEPTLLSPDAPESSVPLNGNMTTLVGKWIGRLSLMGQGAGKYPTGSSLVQDMIDISEHAAPTRSIPCW